MSRIAAGGLSFLLTLSSLCAAAQTSGAPPAVLASIRPVHAIAAAVMGAEGAPELLVSGTASPHSYALRPSEARKLERAEIVFWIGPGMETFLEGPLQTLAKDARVYALIDSPGLVRLPAREGGLWDAHEHEEPAGHAAEGAIDPHIWLDPRNGAAMARAIAEVLAGEDAARAADYRRNAETYASRLDALDRAIAARIGPAQTRDYIVFHDAYQYFETRYGLTPAGSVTVASDRPPGTRRVVEIRERIETSDMACVFSPPQFSPRLVAMLTEGAQTRTGTLDELGTEIDSGAALYEALLFGLSDDFLSCLAP